MIYFIYGSQNATIKNRLKKIVKDNLENVDDMNYVRFDGSNVLVQDWLEEIKYIPLGYDHKVVAVDNCDFLLNKRLKGKIESEQDYKALLKYIDNPNPDCDLIITTLIQDDYKIDEKNAIVKLLKAKATVYEILEADKSDWLKYTRNYIETKLERKIDNDALNELIERTRNDVALFQNSAIKLSLYTEHITYNDVCLMVARLPEESGFLLFNYLMSGQNGHAIALFRDLKRNSEPTSLITMLANQFRLLSQISYLVKERKSDEEIAKLCAIKTGRAAIFRRYTSSISYKNILKTLNDLYELDGKIKSSQVDRFYAFELFLINFKKD